VKTQITEEKVFTPKTLNHKLIKISPKVFKTNRIIKYSTPHNK